MSTIDSGAFLTVEGCPKCGGWHPDKRCTPAPNISGLVPCNECGGWHYRGNGKVCYVPSTQRQYRKQWRKRV